MLKTSCRQQRSNQKLKFNIGKNMSLILLIRRLRMSLTTLISVTMDISIHFMGHLVFWIHYRDTKKKEWPFIYPSGTSKKGLTVQVGTTQTTLDIYCTCPSVLTDVTLLHKYWLYSEGGNKIEWYNPRVVGFGNSFWSFHIKK